MRDCIINQSCLLYRAADNTLAVIYIPHLLEKSMLPYYLPPVEAVAIVYDKGTISTHYLPHAGDNLAKMDESDRTVRIALHLLQTAHKHAHGVMNGYIKRVEHDRVVPRVVFQDTYIRLKQKYAKDLVAGWAEKTDPTKHVFEDIAIAAFLIVLWGQMYKSPDEFAFVDVGCGNGLLVYLLRSEGFKGWGVDARKRKSWETYPGDTRDNLHERVIVPKVLVEGNPEQAKLANNPVVDTLPLPDNAFIIGNHSDELTLWIPLLGYPFMVIPCCSHALSGSKTRFPPKDEANKSTYAALVYKVETICSKLGWKAEKEMLRIPSTRNAAIIGRVRTPGQHLTPHEVLELEGGADGWIQRTLALQNKAPRDH
jgi:tRNASer (uridine44-2'-O)-methyltransferase